MMRISEHGNVIIMLAASSARSAQSDDCRIKSQNHSGAADVRQIVESLSAATQRHWQARLQQPYAERDQVQGRDSEGHMPSKGVRLSRTILVNRVLFEKLLEGNGQRSSAEEERKEEEKLDNLSRETPEQRAEPLRKQGEGENTSFVRGGPKAFDSQVVDEEVVNGRPTYAS
jgi:hypothetical protein